MAQTGPLRGSGAGGLGRLSGDAHGLFDHEISSHGEMVGGVAAVADDP